MSKIVKNQKSSKIKNCQKKLIYQISAKIYNEKRHPDGSFDKDKARAVVGETKDVCTADQTST